MNCWRWRCADLSSRVRRRKRKAPNRCAVFHAELFAVSGAGGHSRFVEKCCIAQTRFQPAGRRGIEARENLELRCGADVCDNAECAERARLQTAELEKLCRAQNGVVVLDEAYVDFADEHALKLALKFSHVLIARTFSKAYSLCFQRVGYFIGQPELIAALDKIRDSYNVNGLGQIAAAATLGDLKFYRANFKKIISTREWLSRELVKLGFRVFAEQDEFYSGAATEISGARLVAETARPENSRALVQRAGGQQLFARHHRHAGGSGGFSESGAEDFNVTSSLRPEHRRTVPVPHQNLSFAEQIFFATSQVCIWNATG